MAASSRPKPPKLQPPVVELGKDLLGKVKAWREADPSSDNFDVSEDAEEVVRYLEAAKFQLEKEFETQLSNDCPSQSKEAYGELLKAQAVDDISRAMSCIDQIVDYLDQFIEEYKPKRGRPKGSTGKRKSKAISRHKSGTNQKQGHQGSKTKRASDKTIAPKGMGKRAKVANTNSSSPAQNIPGYKRATRMAIFRIYCDLGCPLPSEWNERGDGTISEIIRRLEMPTGTSTRQCVHNTLLKCHDAIEKGVPYDGKMNTENMGRPPKIKPGSQEEDMIAEYVEAGNSIPGTTAIINAHRLEEGLVPFTISAVRGAYERMPKVVEAVEVVSQGGANESGWQIARRAWVDQQLIQHGMMNYYDRYVVEDGNGNRMALKRSNFIGPVQPWLDDTAFGPVDGIRKLDRTHISIEQIGFWDETHFECITGMTIKSGNNKVVRFKRNAEGKIDPNGTELIKKQVRFQPKYNKQGRYCLGCAVVQPIDGERMGVVDELFDYSGKKLITLAEWLERIEKEIRRVKNLRSAGVWMEQKRTKGEYWRTDDVEMVKGIGATSKSVLFDNDITTVGQLIDLNNERMAIVCASASTQVANKIRAAQVEAQRTVKEGEAPEPDKDHRRADNPYLSKYGDDWEKVIAKTAALSGYALVTEMIRHIHDETEKMMKGTVHEEDWFFYHDALSLMTCNGTVEWMKKEKIYERWLTPMHFDKSFGRFADRPPGNSPELMPWDNSLNKDLKDALLFHVCLTYELDEDDPLKFSLSTPKRMTKAVRRILENGWPSSQRVVQDTDKVLVALKKISEAEGAYVPGLANRNGWRRRNEGGHGGKRVCLSDAERLARATAVRIHPILDEWMREKNPYNEFKRGAQQGDADSEILEGETSSDEFDQED